MPRVLLADDNEAIRQAMRGMFVRAGDGWCVCGEAANGLEAVQLAAKVKPDVVLLDFQMPVMNGLDAAREIAKDHPSLPIAMYTLHQNSSFEEQARAFGVRKVISKTDVFSALIPACRNFWTVTFDLRSKAEACGLRDRIRTERQRHLQHGGNVRRDVRRICILQVSRDAARGIWDTRCHPAFR